MNSTNHEFSKLEIPVIVKLVILYELTHRMIFKFPKHERYSLGEKIEKSILQSMELFVTINQSSKYDKEKLLINANAKIELLKILFRVSLNCKIIDTNVYLNIESKLQEIGKMTQGWIKFSKNNA